MTDDTPPTRRCGPCGRTITRGEPDPCLGTLPGVDYACCGHGEGEGYICFTPGPDGHFVTVRFDAAAMLIVEHAHRHPPDPDGHRLVDWDSIEYTADHGTNETLRADARAATDNAALYFAADQ